MFLSLKYIFKKYSNFKTFSTGLGYQKKQGRIIEKLHTFSSFHEIILMSWLFRLKALGHILAQINPALILLFLTSSPIILFFTLVYFF